MQKINITKHCWQRMEERQIDILTLLDCLEYGQVCKYEPNTGKFKIRYGIYIILVKKENNYLIVITVHFISKVKKKIEELIIKFKMEYKKAIQFYFNYLYPGEGTAC